MPKKVRKTNRGEEHGLRKTSEYYSWKSMIQRCENSNHDAYPRYGGRGIKICQRWRKSFINFLTDMGQRPIGTCLERRDNNGNYEPNNCYWATQKQQARNRRSNRIITINGDSLTISEWSEKTGVSKLLIQARAAKGWKPEECICPDKNFTGKGYRLITHKGMTMTIMNWAKYLNIPHECLRSRLKKGWSEERTLTTPYSKKE